MRGAYLINPKFATVGNMQDFIYTGPVNSAVTIDGVDTLLWKGKTVSLPQDNDYVKSMIAQGYLKEPEVVQPEKKLEIGKAKEGN